jgi:muramoyltetrapeptide carboxypeptidase
MRHCLLLGAKPRLFVAFVLTLAAKAHGDPPAASTWPAALAPGDTVMFVAPAGPPERDQVMRAKQRFENRGYKVKMRDDLFDVEGYLAGTDDRRAAELMEAFTDPEVKGVLCVRGGYGVMRILDKLDYDVIRANPKLVLGFSDITALHAALNRRAGLVSLHGPGPASGLGSEQGPTDFTEKYALQALESGEPASAGGAAAPSYAIEVPPSVAKVGNFGAGKAAGRLVGGNLSLISALEGTPYAIETDGAILLIEDVNEAPYRIDRMLQQMKLAGKLDQIRGAVLGQFTTEFVREDKLTDDKRFDTNGVLRQYFQDAGIPVLTNFPVGHHQQNATLPLGAEIEIDADQKTLRILKTKE